MGSLGLISKALIKPPLRHNSSASAAAARTWGRGDLRKMYGILHGFYRWRRKIHMILLMDLVHIYIHIIHIQYIYNYMDYKPLTKWDAHRRETHQDVWSSSDLGVTSRDHPVCSCLSLFVNRLNPTCRYFWFGCHFSASVWGLNCHDIPISIARYSNKIRPTSPIISSMSCHMKIRPLESSPYSPYTTKVEYTIPNQHHLHS